MIRYLLGIVIGFSVFFFAACSSRKQAENQTTDSTVAASSSVEMANSAAVSERLADLGLTANTDWRGINLGDDFAKIKSIEKAELFENDADHVGYTIEFKNLETADMLYYQTNQKVSAIDADLFLNDRQSVDTYKKELTDYFTARYGTPKSVGIETVWTGANAKKVLLKDVSKGKDFGLKVKISSVNNVVTASTK